MYQTVQPFITGRTVPYLGCISAKTNFKKKVIGNAQYSYTSKTSTIRCSLSMIVYYLLRRKPLAYQA